MATALAFAQAVLCPARRAAAPARPAAAGRRRQYPDCTCSSPTPPESNPEGRAPIRIEQIRELERRRRWPPRGQPQGVHPGRGRADDAADGPQALLKTLEEPPPARSRADLLYPPARCRRRSSRAARSCAFGDPRLGSRAAASRREAMEALARARPGRPGRVARRTSAFDRAGEAGRASSPACSARRWSTAPSTATVARARRYWSYPDRWRRWRSGRRRGRGRSCSWRHRRLSRGSVRRWVALGATWRPASRWRVVLGRLAHRRAAMHDIPEFPDAATRRRVPDRRPAARGRAGRRLPRRRGGAPRGRLLRRGGPAAALIGEVRRPRRPLPDFKRDRALPRVLRLATRRGDGAGGRRERELAPSAVTAQRLAREPRAPAQGRRRRDPPTAAA